MIMGDWAHMDQSRATCPGFRGLAFWFALRVIIQQCSTVCWPWKERWRELDFRPFSNSFQFSLQCSTTLERNGNELDAQSYYFVCQSNSPLSPVMYWWGDLFDDSPVQLSAELSGHPRQEWNCIGCVIVWQPLKAFLGGTPKLNFWLGETLNLTCHSVGQIRNITVSVPWHSGWFFWEDWGRSRGHWGWD